MTTTEANVPVYLTADEVAQVLGVSRTRIGQLAREGRLPVAAIVGGRGMRLYDPAAIEALAVERAIVKAAQ